MNTNPFRRRIAKRVFWLSEKLDWLKTPSRTYTWNESVEEPGFEFAGWTMLPALSIWLMDWSWDLDPHCWDHWAPIHDDCELVPCAMCNGCACTPKDWGGA